MSDLITCLRCKQQIDSQYDQCPHCGERVTLFQRTYSSRLLDGKYQILDRLGVGGMGEIFKVRHIHLNELRVIKIMRPNVASDDQGLQRFLQEARTSTMIKHKNLAMLYDFAQLDDGSYYMVWEFIDGTNIQKWIAQNGPVPPRLSIEISIQALNGLEHLHSMGLIHRDISPENIMLSQDHHGKLLVKVIDFGIAKSLAEGESAQHLTQTGMFLGKLKYASPEQAGFLREGEHLDPRSDLYSFGIVMYEMLAGRAPFVATNPNSYILKHVQEKPAPLAQVNPAVKVPPQLEAVVMRALEKNRDARYASADEFAKALEGIRDSIAPDAKYGLGEKMITLSGAQTLADLPKVNTGTFGTGAGTFPGGTKPAPRGPKPDEATVIERSPSPVQAKTLGSDEATVMENFGRTQPGGPAVAGGAAPTSVEPKWTPQSPAAAEPTVIERQIAPPPAKKSSALWIGIAAVVVVALGVGGWLVLRKPSPSQQAGTTAAPSGTQVTATAPTGTAPAPPGQGVLLLSASPWGDLEKIVNEDTKQPVNLSDEKRSTPTRIELQPGKYSVTMAGPAGRSSTFDVQIEAGERKPVHKDLGSVDFNELEKEMQQQ
jgi:eukaryotic-like serine/threonine-protein kinase